jgi:MFS family permease
MGVKLTMLIFTILMAAVLLVSASTAVPIALYACFFALGMLSSIVYICSLSVQTDWFPGKLLGLSYGITQTGVGLGVNLISVVLPLLGKQDFYSVVYMASTFLVCTGVMSALLLDQHVPGHIFEVLGGLKRRWRRQDTPTVGDYVPFPAGTDSKADIEITSKTGTKGEVEANAKASPTGLASFRSTFGHPSVVYLLLATFFFAVHVRPSLLVYLCTLCAQHTHTHTHTHKRIFI